MGNFGVELNENNQFSLFEGQDLRELLVQIENFDLIYRDGLGLSSEKTFGLEIEYEKLSKKYADQYVHKNLKDWISKEDGSLRGGGEIVSPILCDKKSAWLELKNVCCFLKESHASTFWNAGGHIHVGAHLLGNNYLDWLNFIKLYVVYEKVLFRFFYGDKLTARRKIRKYAFPISDTLRSKMFFFELAEKFSDILVFLPLNKYLAVNFSHLDDDVSQIKPGNTIEFRIPNGTIEEVVWQNNINTCLKLLNASKSSLLDVEKLDYQIKNEFISSTSDFYLYDEIFLKDSLDFVDIIFENNLDKIYFLRQYFKDFQSNYRVPSGVKAKKFFR